MKLSIVTPTFNRAKSLEMNLESVLSQTFKDLEHIIVDNMSNDGTLELVKDYKNKADYPVIYIRDNDTGIYNAINKGIKSAKGEWIHILNSDDNYYSADCLKDLFFAKDNNQFDLLVSTIVIRNLADGSLQNWVPVYNKDWDHYNFPHPGIIIKHDFYKEKGYYSEKFRIVSDAIFGIVNYKDAKYRVIDKPLVTMADNGISNIDNFRSIYEKVIVLLFYHKFPLLIKLKYVVIYFKRLIKLVIKEFIQKLLR